MNVREEVRNIKDVSPVLAASSNAQRNTALEQIRLQLLEHKEEIFAENRKDLAAADAAGISQAVVKRLKFDEGKLQSSAEGLAQLQQLPDPLGRVTLRREMDKGLLLERVTCPIGVIGVIFEARPDALIQISALCLKSGNCAVLKGGKETTYTNRILFRLIREGVIAAGLPENCLLQAESHSEIGELLQCDDCVDLLIPRGSNAFVRYIMDNTRIPVMGHSDGLCHIYVDQDADPEMAIPLILDAKTQYTAACNAVETLLVHKKIAADFLPKLAEACREAGIEIRGTKAVTDIIGGVPVDVNDFREYLDLIVSAAIVDDIDAAIAHINRFGSHHTDAILTENAEAAAHFMQMVDSAGVYQNCSTRFADGFRYGFGAEVGISTGKLHARGPVGLDGLVTYKYRIFGHGQIVGDYAEGRSHFHFRDL